MTFGVLLKNAFKGFFGAKGILLLLLAAAFPTLLTGAWVVTHLADPVAVSLSWDPEEPQRGNEVNFTAEIRNDGRGSTGEFNATVSLRRAVVDFFSGEVTFARPVNRTEPVPSLSPGEQTTVTVSWTPQNAGVFAVFLVVDPDDEVGELEDVNNIILNQIFVGEAAQGEDQSPTPPGNLTGASSSAETVDANVTEIRMFPVPLRPGENATFEAIIANEGPSDLRDAEVVIEVGTVSGNQMFPRASIQETVNITAGETTNVTLTWPNAPPGPYWVQAYVNVSANQTDAVAENNFESRPLVINYGPLESIPRPDLDQRVKVTNFYVQVLLLHFWVIVPFIALFFAGGIISDEKSEGNLVYLLTRPIPRVMLLVPKFIAGFVMGAVAVSLANAAAFVILFGFGVEKDIGFLMTPWIASLIALFAYTAIFTLFGVIFDRPYVAGIIYILVWESLGLFNNLLAIANVDFDIVIAQWVEQFTVIFHLGTALGSWPLDEGVHWLPSTEASMEPIWALVKIIGAALVCLVVAAGVMQTREFDV